MIATNTRSTKDRLLDEAEKLFAEYGIEAVSPRQIALAASQGNQSAILYHFGSKDDLISTLLARRVSEINHVRRAMLAQILDAGEADMRALVGAIALPLAKWIEEHENGGCYVRFLAHLWSDRRRRDVANEQSEDAAPLRLIFKEMRKLLPTLPEELWVERLRLAVGGIIHALASRERLRASRCRLGCIVSRAVRV